MKKIIKTPLAAAVSTAVVSVFSVATVNADTNPFAMTELSNGYMQVAEDNYSVVPWGGGASKKANEASCGEGKCGGTMEEHTAEMKKEMEKGKEGACGEMDQKAKKGMEGKKDKMRHTEKDDGEMSCGGMKDKMKGMSMEGKDGEMSCGAMMDKMKKGMDMKGKEKGGEMSCGAMAE